MKRIISLMTTMMFALALGSAYAGALSKELFNGVTDFTGRSYDTLEIGQAGPDAVDNSYEGSAAGGLREEESNIELYNGITDFKGGSYDTFEIGPVASLNRSVESSAAGGLREGESSEEPYNGVTDFKGGSYDTFEIGR